MNLDWHDDVDEHQLPDMDIQTVLTRALFAALRQSQSGPSPAYGDFDAIYEFLITLTGVCDEERLDGLQTALRTVASRVEELTELDIHYSILAEPSSGGPHVLEHHGYEFTIELGGEHCPEDRVEGLRIALQTVASRIPELELEEIRSRVYPNPI